MATEERRRWWVLVTMTGALSMVLIDQTVVSVALVSIKRDLHIAQTALPWVVDAYLLSLAVLVAMGGRLADLVGPERTFRAGATVFVLASALCGVAPNEVWLFAARGLQGVGGAMMVPSTGALVVSTFPPDRRGRAMGVYSGISMVFLALGPPIGGLLTTHVGWRAVFFVNLPIGVAILALARLTLPRRPRLPVRRADIDVWGVPLSIAALGTLVLGLMQARGWGWGSPGTLALLALAPALLALLLVHERRTTSPLIDPGVVAVRGFAADAVVLAGVEFALIAASVFGAVWSQQVLGFSPATAGAAILPLSVPLLVVAPLAGRLYDRIGARAVMTVGALLIAAGLGWLGWHLPQRSYGQLVTGYVLMGAGIGCTISVGTADALGRVAAASRSQASGIVQTLRQVGGAVGIAALGAVVSGVSAVARSASPTVRVHAATAGVADAYLIASAVMLGMALLAVRFVAARGPATPPPLAAVTDPAGH